MYYSTQVFYGSGETSNLSTRRMAQFYRGGLKPYNFSTSYSTVVQYYENIIIYSCWIKKRKLSLKISTEDFILQMNYRSCITRRMDKLNNTQSLRTRDPLRNLPESLLPLRFMPGKQQTIMHCILRFIIPNLTLPLMHAIPLTQVIHHPLLEHPDLIQ